MRHVYVVTLICLLISLVLAGNFAMTYKPGTLSADTPSATGLTTTANAGAPLIQKEEINLETTEQANLIGIGVIFGAVIVVTALAVYRKPGASDEEI